MARLRSSYAKEHHTCLERLAILLRLGADLLPAGPRVRGEKAQKGCVHGALGDQGPAFRGVFSHAPSAQGGVLQGHHHHAKRAQGRAQAGKIAGFAADFPAHVRYEHRCRVAGHGPGRGQEHRAVFLHSGRRRRQVQAAQRQRQRRSRPLGQDLREHPRIQRPDLRRGRGHHPGHDPGGHGQAKQAQGSAQQVDGRDGQGPGTRALCHGAGGDQLFRPGQDVRDPGRHVRAEGLGVRAGRNAAEAADQQLDFRRDDAGHHPDDHGGEQSQDRDAPGTAPPRSAQLHGGAGPAQ